MGTVKGNGYTISNLYVTRSTTTQGVGLFGAVENTNIEDLKVAGSITSKGGQVGMIAGYSQNSNFTNCSTNGSVNGSSIVGGIVGYMINGTVTQCNNSATVKGQTSSIGGIVGNLLNEQNIANNGRIVNCINNGTISGANSIGGILGYQSNNCLVTNSCNKANVSGTQNHIGGIVGTSNAIIENCYNTSGVTGGYMVGGIAGRQFGEAGDARIYYSYNKGNITANSAGPEGNTNVGGICGVLARSSNMYYCYNLGTIRNTSGRTNVGGITGSLSAYNTSGTSTSLLASKARYCYNSGSVISNGTHVRRNSRNGWSILFRKIMLSFAKYKCTRLSR